MRRVLRSIALMIGTSFRASPGLATAVFALTALSAAGLPAGAFALKILVDAILRGDGDAVTGAAILTASITAITIFAGSAGIGTMRMSMEERTRLYLERRIIRLVGAIPGVAHHELPEHANEIGLLRGSQGLLAQPAGPLVFLFRIAISSAGSFALLARIDPWLLLLPLFGIPSLVAGGISTKLHRKASEATIERQRLAIAMFNMATVPRAAKETRIYGLRDELTRRERALRAEIRQDLTRASVRGAVLQTIGWVVFALGYVGAILLVVRRAVNGEATAGDVFLAITLAGQVNSLVAEAVQHVQWLGSSLKVIGRILWLTDYAADEDPQLSDPAAVPDRITEGIELRGVSFRYPGTETDVLHDVNLHIPAGATIAIVGENGAGKSTLVKLLCRFYEPTAGEIMLDGMDLKRFDFADWRRRLSAGFQDFTQFHLLFREAVGVGDIDRIEDAQAVTTALDRASAADAMQGLAAGVETQLGKAFSDGVELSVGQWQKLALARAMMRDEPLLLLLDEPTASLDPQTEHALFERYATGAQRVASAIGAITILVSHRFSTVRMADLIVVVDSGRITEVGTHAELMALGGQYAELYSLQARAYR